MKKWSIIHGKGHRAGNMRLTGYGFVLVSPDVENVRQRSESSKVPKDNRPEVMRLVAAKFGKSQRTAKAIMESLIKGKGGTPHSPSKRWSVDLLVFLEWVKALKGMARMNKIMKTGSDHLPP